VPTRKPPSPAAVVRAHPWLSALVVTLAVAIVMVSLLGGWARSTPDGPARVAVGSEIEATPFRLRLDEAAARYVVDGNDAEPGQAFVVVDAQIELATKTSATTTTLTDAITADLTDAYTVYGTPTDVPEADVTVRADGSTLLGLGPGLSYDVHLTFIVDEGSVPEQMTVTLLEHTRRPSALDGALGWFDAAPVARVTLDVAPLPATRPEPEGF